LLWTEVMIFITPLNPLLS